MTVLMSLVGGALWAAFNFLLTAIAIIVGVTVILVMGTCAMVAGVFLAFSAMAFVMWTISHQPSTWHMMLHGLSYGLVFAGASAAMLIIQAVYAEPKLTPQYSRLPRRSH